VKDVKIRLNERQYELLRKKAADELRSINKQVTVFVLSGLQGDERRRLKK